MSVMSCFKTSPVASGISRKISSPNSGKFLELHKEDVKQIQKSWALVPNKLLFAQQLFKNIFTTKPSLKLLFNGYRLTGTNSAHERRFIQFWDELISDLSEEPENIIAAVREVGFAHCQIKQLSFDAENWLLFKANFMSLLLGDCEINYDRKYQAWNKLLMFVISEMKDAFNCGVVNRNSGSLDNGSTEESALETIWL